MSTNNNLWITKLAPTFPNFWQGLATLEECQLIMELGTSCFLSSVQLKNLLTNPDGTIQLPGVGATLRAHQFSDIYATGGVKKGEDHECLELVSKDRSLKLVIRPTHPQGIRALNYLTGAFADEIIPEGCHLALGSAPHIPKLCPCCETSGQFRVDPIEENPITCILASSHRQNQPLMISIRSSAGSWTSNHLPERLTVMADWLVSEGADNLMRLNIRHLHAIRYQQIIFEGEPYLSLELLNSCGEIYATISAAQSFVERPWNFILGCRDHPYTIHR